MTCVISTYTLTEAQWKCIQSKSTTAALKKIGFNPHAAHAMIFCPKYGRDTGIFGEWYHATYNTTGLLGLTPVQFPNVVR